MQYYLLWTSWLLGTAIATANVVILCMDETCVELHPHGHKGNVALLVNKDRSAWSENLELGKTKENITLIGTVCNDPELQKFLPQILLPKGRKDKDTGNWISIWPVTGMPEPPANVKIWKDTSGWNTAVMMMRYMKTMKAAIHLHRPGAVIVLAMDPHPTHMTKKVLQYSARHFGHTILFPGQLGYLFDILDTKVYNQFKEKLIMKNAAAKVESATGTITKGKFAQLLYDTIEESLVQTNYAAEFPRHGLASNALSLRDPLKQKLDDAPLLAPRKLTPEELNTVLGMKRSVHNLLFNGARFAHLDSYGHAPAASAGPVAMGSLLPPFKKLKTA